MRTDTILAGLSLILVCAAIVVAFMRALYKEKYKHALLFKRLASICFLIFGAYNFFSREFSWTTLAMLVGLCLGIVGDEMIALAPIYPQSDEKYFIGGGTFFLVGHIFYIGALLTLAKFNVIAVGVVFLVMALISALYGRSKDYLPTHSRPKLVLYLGIVVMFASVAMGSFLVRGALCTALLALGGILFVVSDNILFAYKYGKNPQFSQNVILHIAYYLAQFAIAWSVSLV